MDDDAMDGSRPMIPLQADALANDAPIASCDGVSRRFVVPQRRGTGSSVLALDDVSMTVQGGRLVALSGPSGSGKSTLLALLAALDRPTSGTVRVNGRNVGDLDRRARRVVRRNTAVIVLPQPADNLFLRRTGRDNMLAVARHRKVAGDAAGIVDELLTRMELTRFADLPCSAMSGGEQQRMAVACALVGRPPLVLADEPTGALDSVSAATVIDTLRSAVELGATIVVATHDPHIVATADDVVTLDHGRRVA